MRTQLSAWSTLAVLLACLVSMGVGPCGGNGGDDDDATSSGTLTWYYTCGDPVCQGYTGHEGVPACTDQTAGDPCSQEGQQCDPKDDCNRLLVCATSDPTQGEGGCPISQKAHKKDITYLEQSDLARYHDDVMHIKLATYQYKKAPESDPRRLGFLIDDNPQSPAVLPSRERVDLYGYTSMTVAAVQVQDQQIQALREEVDQLKKQLEATNGSKRPCK